eukprot:6190150-Pleurochrysis_carterae.AAC.2
MGQTEVIEGTLALRGSGAVPGSRPLSFFGYRAHDSQATARRTIGARSRRRAPRRCPSRAPPRARPSGTHV